MDIVKKNMWSIVCGVVALLAVGATFYPLGGKFEELNMKLQTSVEDYNKIKRVNNEKLSLPIVDPKSTEVPPLEQFPTDKVIERGRQVVGKVKVESQKLQTKANEMNKRPPLVINALPAGRGRYLVDFKEEYYRGLDQMKKDMNAASVPSEQEIKDEIERIWKEEYEPRVRKVGDQALNEAEVKAEFEEEKRNIPMRMRRQRSKDFTMYLNPEKQGTNWGQTSSLDYDPVIPPPDVNKAPDIIDVWSAQLGYWIQEDVVKAIVETNNSAAANLPQGRTASSEPVAAAPNNRTQGNKISVEDAIIKRLVMTQIKKEYITRTGPLPISSAINPANVAVPAGQLQVEDPTATQGAPKVFAQSATGRVCNPTYDVMHFVVTVDADAQRFETFMTNLTKGKFITILRADIRGVDRERVQQNAHYFYGKNPVVRLTLKCEVLFFRNWTADPQAPLMPVNVQKILKIPQPQPGLAIGG